MLVYLCCLVDYDRNVVTDRHLTASVLRRHLKHAAMLDAWLA